MEDRVQEEENFQHFNQTINQKRHQMFQISGGKWTILNFLTSQELKKHAHTSRNRNLNDFTKRSISHLTCAT